MIDRYQTPNVLVFLHPYSEASWDDQLTRESIIERTVRATIHAKQTLMAGLHSRMVHLVMMIHINFFLIVFQ